MHQQRNQRRHDEFHRRIATQNRTSFSQYLGFLHALQSRSYSPSLIAVYALIAFFFSRTRHCCGSEREVEGREKSMKLRTSFVYKICSYETFGTDSAIVTKHFPSTSICLSDAISMSRLEPLSTLFKS